MAQRIVAALGHCYPFYSGCGTIGNSAIMRRLSHNTKHAVWTQLRNGMFVQIRLDDFNGRAVFFTGDVDRKVTWICSRIVRTGDTVVDVGSNIGLVTLTLAGLVGQTGYVYSFDPNPQLVAMLRRSIQRNALDNIVLQQCAIGETPDSLVLRVPQGHSGQGSLVRHVSRDCVTELTVPVMRLSDALPSSLGHIRFLKIDVEGFESHVLRGASRVFEQSPPDAVLFEVNDAHEFDCGHPALAFLQSHGYAFFIVPRAWMRMRVRPFNPQTDSLVGHDLLATPRGTLYDEMAYLLRSVAR